MEKSELVLGHYFIFLVFSPPHQLGYKEVRKHFQPYLKLALNHGNLMDLRYDE